MAKKLTKKQLAVLDDMFSDELDEQAVLDKYDLSRNQYYKWLIDDCFAEQFDRRIAAAYRQSAALIARYATLAAVKLVHLTDSQSAETARKACLDIISMQNSPSGKAERQIDNRKSETGNLPSLSPATASKLLEVLAQENQQREKNEI